MMGLFPVSCDLFCFDDCACGRLPTPRNFVIDSMIVGIIANNQDADPDQGYSVDDLVIRVLPSEVTYTHAASTTPSFSIFSQAFACSPIPPGSAHPLKSIKFISNTAFFWNGRMIRETEEITDLFRVAGFGSDTSFESLIRYRFNFLEQIPLDIRIKEQPSEETGLDINLKITLSDDREFVFEGLRFRVK